MSDIDYLVPDPQVAREFNITLMTVWRWDHDPAKISLGWPPKIKSGKNSKRNYRSRNQLEAFKKNLIAVALAERASTSTELASA
jgi:hypothetical protein